MAEVLSWTLVLSILTCYAKIIFTGVSVFANRCPCAWCHGSTSCLVCGPVWETKFLNDSWSVCLTWWRMSFCSQVLKLSFYPSKRIQSQLLCTSIFQRFESWLVLTDQWWLWPLRLNTQFISPFTSQDRVKDLEDGLRLKSPELCVRTLYLLNIFLFRTHAYVPSFYIIPQHGNGAGAWNPPSWKAMTFSSYIFNTMP